MCICYHGRPAYNVVISYVKEVTMKGALGGRHTSWLGLMLFRYCDRSE